MKTLHGFSHCKDGEVSVCEVEGKLQCTLYENINTSFTSVLDQHPIVSINFDGCYNANSNESYSLFLPTRDSFLTQVTKICIEEGVLSAFRFISSKYTKNSKIMSFMHRCTVRITDVFNKFHQIMQPRLYNNARIIICDYSQVRHWSNSPIRFISWHPHTLKLAVASRDDSVRIYSSDNGYVPVLKSKMQLNITCMAWRPHSSSEIAVACEKCILIWTVDPTSVVTRPSNSLVLHRINHHPVLSIAWSPYGDYLVSSAYNESSLLIWDVATDMSCPLKRLGSPGNGFLAWSPSGTKLIAAATSPFFRVWNCDSWTSDRWETATGPVHCACWSPCGSVLLFVTADEPILYSLYFEMKVNDSNPDEKFVLSPKTANSVYDLSKTTIEDGKYVIGGLIQTMEWDPNGRYLAILFSQSNFVALFMTQINPFLHIAPSSLISGVDDEYPCAIAFQKTFEHGSCLAIGWSSGRLQYFPILYSDRNDSSCFELSPRKKKLLNTSVSNPYDLI